MKLIGKKIRINRIIDPGTNTALVLPMDHAVDLGYFQRLENPRDLIKKALLGGANALLLRRGLVKSTFCEFAGRAGLILRVTCATSLGPDPSYQKLASSVEEAVRLGADAVIAMVQIGHKKEPEMLHNIGILSDACDEWSIVLVGESYPFQGKFSDVYDPEIVRVGARILSEEGADLIKTCYTGSTETFHKVITYCQVPVLVAGGPKQATERDVLSMVEGAMEAGATGVCMGRNIWQAKDPLKMTKAVARIVRERADIRTAQKELI